MAIEKALYQAPEGIDEAPADAIEIEVVDPESMSIKMDGMEIEIEPHEMGETDFDANLAEFMDDSQLSELGSELTSDVENDENSRKDWADMLVKGLEVLGIKYEERTEPWNGACGIFSTLLSEAAIRFQSETIMETFPAKGPVKTKILGQPNKFKEEAAERVQADMNYQLTDLDLVLLPLLIQERGHFRGFVEQRTDFTMRPAQREMFQRTRKREQKEQHRAFAPGPDAGAADGHSPHKEMHVNRVLSQPGQDFLGRKPTSGQVSRNVANQSIRLLLQQVGAHTKHAAQQGGLQLRLPFVDLLRMLEEFDVPCTTFGKGMFRQRQNRGAVGQVIRDMVKPSPSRFTVIARRALDGEGSGGS